MPAVLLQILLVPAAASVVIFATSRRAGRYAGWIAAGSLLYATVLAAIAGLDVARGAVIAEEYLLIAPDVRLGLLADGLSLPTLAIVLLLCTALAFYSIRYVEQRVESLYGSEPDETQTASYARFWQ